VYIVEDIKLIQGKKELDKVIKNWDAVIKILMTVDGKKIKNNEIMYQYVKMYDKFKELDLKIDISVDTHYYNDMTKIRGINVICCGNNLNDMHNDNKKEFKKTIIDEKVNMKAVIEGMNKNKNNKIEHSLKKDNYDEIKILKKIGGIVYTNWYKDANERKNRVSSLIYRENCINIDEVELEDIDYYLNNRLYRKDYIEMFSFLKYVKMYKKWEYENETDFVKLVMNKSGFDDEKKVRDAVKWWKIKNKWRRFLSTDENKAYRMIIGKLKKEVK